MGRYKSDDKNIKNNRIHIRVDRDTLEKLRYCKLSTGMTITALIEMAIDNIYNNEKTKDLNESAWDEYDDYYDDEEDDYLV